MVLFPQHLGKLRHSWLILLILCCLSAYFLQQMELSALLVTSCIFAFAWFANSKTAALLWRQIATALFIVSALALAMHVLPGFHSLLVIDHVSLTPTAIPYSLYLNIDKTLVGLFILGLFYQRPANILPWRSTGKILLWLLPTIVSLIILAAVLLNYIKFEPKIIDGLWLWIWANLFFTCTAEEAFFRGLIQKKLVKRLDHFKSGKWLALIITSLLFGLAHLAGGWEYVLLSTIAGLGYGLAYQLTGRIEVSIFTHFIVNLVHISLFTYPALI